MRAHTHARHGTANETLSCLHTALHEHRIRDVTCGMAHTLVLSDEGVVFAWGAASDGQLDVGICLCVCV